MPARLSAFVVWALVAASALFWGFRWRSPSSAAPVAVAGLGVVPVLSDELSRVLGSASMAPAITAVAEPPLLQRFRLLGLVATRSQADSQAPGVALIAVDSAPPRAFAVGSHIEADVFLQSVGATTATLSSAQGAPLGVLQAPAIGTLLARPASATPPIVPVSNPPNRPISTLPGRLSGAPATAAP